DAAGAVALVDDLLEVLGARLAGGAFDRALDVVLGHAERPRLVDRVAQPHVGRGVAAAGARGDVDRPAKLGEELPALGVDQALAMRDVGRMRMSCHLSLRLPCSFCGSMIHACSYVGGWSEGRRRVVPARARASAAGAPRAIPWGEADAALRALS